MFIIKFIFLKWGFFAYLLSLFFFPSPLFFWRRVWYALGRSLIHSNTLRRIGKRRHELPALTAHRVCALGCPLVSTFYLTWLCCASPPTSRLWALKQSAWELFWTQTFHFSFQNSSALLNPSLESEGDVCAQCLEDGMHLCLVQETTAYFFRKETVWFRSVSFNHIWRSWMFLGLATAAGCH